MKTGLVLEGVGNRGIYIAGVVVVLLVNNVAFYGVIGVSAGAIHGCSFVAGQVGRSIRYNLKYGNDYRFMSWRSWFESGNIVDTQFCYHDLPDFLDPFDNEAFKKSRTKFYVTCSNVESGNAEYILCHDLKAEIDYLRASASLPMVSKIVEVGGKKLLDGGICDSIPLAAFEQLGYEKNIVVLTRPSGYRKKPSCGAWLAALVYRKFPKFVAAIKNRYWHYNQELDYVEKQRQAGKAFVLCPSRVIKISRMEKDLNVVKQMYDLGREDALRHLPQIQAFLKQG